MNDTHKTIDSYINALRERATQAGGLEYALGFLYSTLKDLKLQGYELDRLMADTANLNDLIAMEKKQLAENRLNDNWLPACGGTEVPFKSRSGKRLQYVWQPSTGHHAYLDVDSDIILSDEEAEACLALH
jgi:hypothetical protein